MRNHTTRLASLYPYIKGLPGRGNQLPLTIAFITLTVLLASLLIHQILLFFALSYYSIILVNYLFSRSRRELINFRRLNGVTVVESVLTSLGLMSAYLTYLGGVWVIIASIIFSSLTALATMIRGLIVRVLSGDNLAYSIKYSLTITTIQVFSFSFINLENIKTSMIAGQLIGNATYIIYSSILDIFLKVKGLKPIELLSAMLAIFLNGVKEPLEKLAGKLETKSDIKVESLVFRETTSNKISIALIVPSFHPGPFRDFGSSILPYLIEEKLSRYGIKSVIVKGLSDHSKNIISRRDCEFIADEIVKSIVNHNSNYSRSVGYVKIFKNGPVTTSLVPIGSSTLTLITLHPEGMEDIPYEVMDKINNDELIVIDTHNSFSEDVKELNDRLNDVREALKNISNIHVERNSEILLGYGESNIDGYGLEEGIGPLGIRTIVLKNNGQLSSLVVIDSNNAVPEVREKILAEVKKIKVDYCEVLTTDTHIVNGIKLGGRGYHPLGEVIPLEDIVKSVLRAVKQAIENIKKMEVSKISFTFKDIKVMSNDFLEEAANKTHKSLKLLALTTLITMVTSALLTFALLFLIF
ncbi:MAG: DUF2070 family protein [Aigarchaeota archaeon]|nr:DUF2070 family protein [Aigarchaeota archaeon]MDW7985644.1 DUF2070 family protein [Nitrososphaerota archaeon]